MLDVSFDVPEPAGASAEVRRPHAHAYTILAVSGARTSEGIRLAATGAGPRAVRLTSAEQALASGADAAAAAAAALEDVTPADDALASAWYRRQTLPVLVQRVSSPTWDKETMKLTVNGTPSASSSRATH